MSSTSPFSNLEELLQRRNISLYLLRHAESVANAGAKFISGRSDSMTISEEGRRQATHVQRWIQGNHPPFSHVFCSPATRCKEAIGPELLEIATVIEDLHELEQGEWQGRLRSEVYTTEVRRQIDLDPDNFHAPGGESKAQVEDRMTRVIVDFILPKLTDGSHALVCTHGMAINSLLRPFRNQTHAVTHLHQTPNGSVTLLSANAKGILIFSPPPQTTRTV